MVMQGLNLKSLKKHPSLVPLFVALGAGVGMSVLYTLRIAVQSPDVSWNRKTNPEPWQHYSEKKYKFMYPTAEFKPSQAPKYLE